MHSALLPDPGVKGPYHACYCTSVTGQKWPQSCPWLLRQHTVYQKWWFEKQKPLSILNYKQWLLLTMELSIGFIDSNSSPLAPWGFLYIILQVFPDTNSKHENCELCLSVDDFSLFTLKLWNKLRISTKNYHFYYQLWIMHDILGGW